MAIGIGKLLGFRFLGNFRFPYFSRDIAEFWRRWHISLNTWFRDYLYIPLGGSRGSKAMVIRNTFIIFLVSGFWHGANWTFIVWGGFHALLFMPLLLMKKNRKNTDTVAENHWLPSIKEFFQMILTFALVVFGWIFFRADSIHQAIEYIGGIFDMSFFSKSLYIVGTSKTLFCLAIMVVVEWFQRQKEHGLSIDFIKYKVIRIAIYYILLFLVLEFGANQQSFIYFQF
jgi:D-alanyl-lipoteichoic acid acyltransferase DltB (MBOAT superfamily)